MAFIREAQTYHRNYLIEQSCYYIAHLTPNRRLGLYIWPGELTLNSFYPSTIPDWIDDSREQFVFGFIVNSLQLHATPWKFRQSRSLERD